MPRYFFHIHIGDHVVVDPDGRELDDANVVWGDARELALQLLQGADSDPELLKAVLFVADEAEEIVLEFPLTEALMAEPVDQPEEDGGTLH
ncbi:hypothetical protein [uncultured Methylobacterium sp.]|uniref:DUF6894 family protein n=1 Tax=uncultured Methylobacterium sp. TaxID=157278 RepID=UPI002595745A|nr:hypothetical protein [uncultured Methylobacterium sp.]